MNKVSVSSGICRIAGLLLACSLHLSAATVTLEVAPSFVVDTLKGGLGASMHAIDGGQGSDGRQICNGGSACGGNPEPSDTAGWNSLYRHADWLGMDFCRVEFEQKMYEPKIDSFSFDNKEMRILYRWLDWCESRNVDVFFQQMWTNVGWTAGDSVKAAGLARFMDHIINTKKYTCIRYLAINNEPAIWWDWTKPLLNGFTAVRRELDKRGIAVPLSGPDDFNWSYPAVRLDSLNPVLGAFDMHQYGISGFSRNSGADAKTFWTGYAHTRGKPFFMSEIGSQIPSATNPSPGQYDPFLPVAKMMAGLFNAGVDGINRWSFTNRGDMDGQWQMVRTFNITTKTMYPAPYEPVPNVYYMFAMLSRYMAKHSGIAGSVLNDASISGNAPVSSVAFRSPQGNMSYVFVNSSDSAASLTLNFKGAVPQKNLYRYGINRAEHLDVQNVIVNPTRIISAPLPAVIRDSLPPKSLVVLSNYNLSASDKGIQAESPCGDCSPVNLALRKPVTATQSYDTTNYKAENMTDGCQSTRWAARHDTDQVVLDLQAKEKIGAVVIVWESGFAKKYRIRASDDKVTWTTVARTDSGKGGIDYLDNLGVSARYIKIDSMARGGYYAPSIWELGVLGPSGSTRTVIPAPYHTAGAVKPLMDSRMEMSSYDLRGRISALKPAAGYRNGCVFIVKASDGTVRRMVLMK